MKIALKNTPVNVSPLNSKPAETPEELMISLKNIRGWMLTESDWTQTQDSPLNEETKEAWRMWRQELRDITQQINIDNVGDWFEVTDPPEKGLPKTWLLWEYETFFAFIEEQNELTRQAELARQAQEGEEPHVH